MHRAAVDHAHVHDHHDHGQHLEWVEVGRILFCGLSIVALWFIEQRVWHVALVIGVLATIVSGWPIFREAIENLLERRMTMELSMTIALLAALAIGQFLTALVILFFVLIAEVIEGMTVGRGRNAIKHLLDLLPREATLYNGAGTRAISVDELKVDDVVLVKPGGRIPVDGIVVGGASAVDEATITGESMPVEKTTGMQVFAGTINQSGALEVRVTRTGENTAFGKIVQAVEHAEKLRAKIQKTADRLAGYLVYFAFVCAIITFGITRDARSTISVIIVAGACGIAAGTPLAILGAIGRAARIGSIVKGGVYLETLGKITTVVFDKTGTLTCGALKVTYVKSASGVEDRDVLEAATVAERRSEHPIAKAIVAEAQHLGISGREPDEFSYTPGKGVICKSNGQEIVVGTKSLFADRHLDVREIISTGDPRTQIFVARSRKVLGAIGVADLIRPEAKDAIAALKRLGMRTVMLTGDARAIADTVAKEIGIDEAHAELLPDEKVKEIRQLIDQGQTVAMIGDGINDAPALMQANVGIAMGAGTDVAQESADILLIGNDLLRFVETVRVAKRCRAIIMFNFTGTLVVDAIGVGLAAWGLLNPLLAALIHVGSELAFILNSARLLPATSHNDVRTQKSIALSSKAVDASQIAQPITR